MPKPLAIALTVSHRKKPPVGLVPTEAEVSSYKGRTSLSRFIIHPPSGRMNDKAGGRVDVDQELWPRRHEADGSPEVASLQSKKRWFRTTT